jgi:FMN reductase
VEEDINVSRQRIIGFLEACTVSTAIYASATEFETGQPPPPIIAARLANSVDQFAGHLKARCADAA